MTLRSSQAVELDTLAARNPGGIAIGAAASCNELGLGAPARARRDPIAELPRGVSQQARAGSFEVRSGRGGLDALARKGETDHV